MIKNLLFSFVDITKNILFAKKANVLFYYPQHFNRSANGTNPFFDPMLEACEKNGISYKLIEEPDDSTKNPHNKNAIKGDFLFLLICLLRKVAHTLHPQKDLYENEVYIARWLNILTFGKLRYVRYVTISGSMQTLFSQMNKSCKAMDIQHGILDNSNTGWFESKGKLRSCFYSDRIHWMLWGKGYEDCLIKDEQNIFKGKTHVVGYPMANDNDDDNDNLTTNHENLTDKVILVSLQFTADWPMDKLENIKGMIITMLCELEVLRLKVKGLRVVLKHHPRYNNIIDISDIFKQFDFVEETKEPLQELVNKTLLQVTFNSTTAFEFADYGIPSYFLGSKEYPQEENLFYAEFEYPLYAKMNISEIVERLQKGETYKEDAETVKEWYKRFYSPFDETEFLKLIEA